MSLPMTADNKALADELKLELIVPTYHTVKERLNAATLLVLELHVYCKIAMHEETG